MDAIDQHFEKLKQTLPDAKLQRRGDNSAVISVPAVQLPPGWNTSTTTIHFLVPPAFPGARPDCFWTDSALRLSSGALPANTRMNEQHPGQNLPGELLWFSFHPSSWDPLRDDLLTYFNIVRVRLNEVR